MPQRLTIYIAYIVLQNSMIIINDSKWIDLLKLGDFFLFM